MKILCATDLLPTSESAIDRAGMLAHANAGNIFSDSVCCNIDKWKCRRLRRFLHRRARRLVCRRSKRSARSRFAASTLP